MGKATGGFEQVVGIRSRKEWFRHKMGKDGKQLVGITGQEVQTGLVVPGKCWWRDRRFGKSGWGKQGGIQSGEGRPRGSGGQWNKQQ